jgi:hypothetical protein
MTARGVIDQTLALFRSATKASHIRLGTGFIDKHETRRIDTPGLSRPPATLAFHVGSVLLTRS